MTEQPNKAHEAKRARQEVWRRLDSYYDAIKERAKVGAEELFERALRQHVMDRTEAPNHPGCPTT